MKYDSLVRKQSMPREKEYASAAQATTRLVGDMQAFDGWLQMDPPLPSILRLEPATATIRVVPTKWNETCLLSEAFTTNKGLLIMVQARAREALSLGVDSKPFGGRGPMLQVTFGAQGNTQTILSYKQKRTMAVGRHCQDTVFLTYWICVTHDKVAVGVADKPGERAIALLELEENDLLTNDDRASKAYIAIGNRAVADRTAPSPLTVRHLRVTALPATFHKKIQQLTTGDLTVVINVDSTDQVTVELMKEYEEECNKAKARAAKFGIPYQPPSAEMFLPWSHARRLRANPNQGFITGIDLFGEDEKAKQEARKKRFGVTTTIEADKEAVDEHQKVIPRVLVTEAWDNWRLVSPERTDPPPALWSEAEAAKHSNEQWVPKKIHIFSIDWAAFKQIRTNDIMAFFNIYGPSYVEWLGDLSCNVHFSDEFSARRALEHMSEPIGDTPVPEGAPELGRMGWRMACRMLRKVSNDRYGRRGTRARLLMRQATTLDILEQRPTFWAKPPPGFSTKRVLGPGSDFPTKQPNKKRSQHRPEPKSLEDRMNQGLSAGRSGFSVGELEAERATKRTKTNES